MSDYPNIEKARGLITEALAKTVDLHETTEGALITGWVVVIESAPLNGDRFLTRINSEGLMSWNVQGFLHNALYESWGEE